MLLALLVVLASSSAPAPLAPQSKRVTPKQPDFPSLAPFVISPIWETLARGNPKEFDESKLENEISTLQLAAIVAEAKLTKRLAQAEKGAASALLQSKLSRKDRMDFSLLPSLMAMTRPMWGLEDWNPLHTSLARAVAEAVAEMPDGPKLRFKNAADNPNAKELRKLGEWFRTQCADPERYAAMIGSVDCGPFVGLPCEVQEVRPAAQTLKLDEHLELRLCRIERAGETWLLQLTRDGQHVWARLVSGAPIGSVHAVAFSRSSPDSLAEHGWKVPLEVSWDAGDKEADFYLCPQGDLLFYYLAW